LVVFAAVTITTVVGIEPTGAAATGSILPAIPTIPAVEVFVLQLFDTVIEILDRIADLLNQINRVLSEFSQLFGEGGEGGD
jgi:hypothetical protein